MDQVCEPYIRRRAVRHLEKKRVCIFAAGTGNPYFTTDTAATLRANEMTCEAIFKGTKVDGVYDKDPKKHADAKRYDTVTYDEVLQKHLGVMDARAIALARDNDLPIIVFSLDEPGGFRGILAGQGTYTNRAWLDRCYERTRLRPAPYTARPTKTTDMADADDFELDIDDLTRRMDGAIASSADRIRARCAPGAPRRSMLEPIRSMPMAR